MVDWIVFILWIVLIYLLLPSSELCVRYKFVSHSLARPGKQTSDTAAVKENEVRGESRWGRGGELTMRERGGREIKRDEETAARSQPCLRRHPHGDTRQDTEYPNYA